MQGPVIMANPRGPRVWSYTHTHFTYIPPATCVCSMVHLVKVTAVPMQHPSFGSFGSFANRWPLYKSRWGQVESVWSTQGTPQRWKDPIGLEGLRTWIGFIVVHSNPECFILQQIWTVYAAISKLQEQDIHSPSFKLHIWRVPKMVVPINYPFLGYPHGKPPYFWVLQTLQHQGQISSDQSRKTHGLFHICVH